METQERDALAALCMMAAFADGGATDAEREHVKHILEGLGGGDLALVSQRVLLRQTTLEAECARLASPETRSLAYEMALAVCDADGPTGADERAFLERLRRELRLDEPGAQALREHADRITTASEPPGEAAGDRSAPAGAATPPSAAARPLVDEAEIDRTIHNHAILAGALELLPSSLATLAIIPVQMKLVYGIGERYGYRLDRGHVQDFLATVGVGLTGQVLEGVARRLVGGLGRAAGGALLGGLLGGATGVAFTFATTWALGQVARTYYAGGRRLDVPAMREMFQRKLDEARGIYPRVQAEIEQRARTIDVGSLQSLVRGG